jgi:hypothetical protein
MAICAAGRGNGPEHCCWVNGQICPFLEIDTMPDRYWACGLRRELGSWDAVHNDPGYIERVRPMWDRIDPLMNCGDWPPPGKTCATCGAGG